jgi:hypothetical protein
MLDEPDCRLLTPVGRGGDRSTTTLAPDELIVEPDFHDPTRRRT